MEYRSDKIIKGDKIMETKIKNIPFFADEKAFIDFVDRITEGKYGRKTNFTLIESQSGFDEYRLKAKDGVIEIWATSGSAGGAALNAYLRKYCHYYYGILTINGELPNEPPETTEDLAEVSVFHYRYIFNYCTFSYSYAFNTWKDWEKITDYLILAGYNLVLNPIANECVWLELLQRFGYTKEEAKRYISAPNYLAWQWMMNCSGLNGISYDWWYEEQKEISLKFNEKFKAFGIGVMLPGYCGAVPDDFCEKYPQARVCEQGEWFVCKRPSILVPDGKGGLFERVAKTYYEIQNELLHAENIHYYSTDPFHEGGAKEGLNLIEYANAVMDSMKAVDPDAVWSFQGWGINPDRDILSTLKHEDTLILNMLADQSPNGGDDFLGHPHVYSVINNFGGQQRVIGSATTTYFCSHIYATDENSSCVGIGLLPEAVECDEILFDIVAEINVRAKLREPKEFLKEYALARYGFVNEEILKALSVLFEEVYVKDTIGNTVESGLLARPTLNVHNVSTWSGTANVEEGRKMNKKLQQVVEGLLCGFSECQKKTGYIVDLVSMVRQMIANRSWEYIYGLNEAFKVKDKNEFSINAQKLLQLFDVQVELVDCDKNLNLQCYLDKAINRGYTQEEKDWFRRIALRLITTWGDQATPLHDYAAREYGDMLRYFYKPRWEKYIGELSFALKNGTDFVDYEHHEDEKSFIERKEEYTRICSTDIYQVVQKALAMMQ